jgi:isocitrate dehydrogenase (NAD+)
MLARGNRIEATLIPGDGIGPQIIAAMTDVFRALGDPFIWDIQQAGMAAIAACCDPLPDATMKSIERTGLALKGH